MNGVYEWLKNWKKASVGETYFEYKSKNTKDYELETVNAGMYVE
jgi:hypothetical protein